MNPNLYTIIKLPGICIIFVAGLIVQYSKYPSYLYSQKGIDIKSLMQFSIAGNISALTINRLNTINRGRVYEIQQVSEVNSSENFLET